MNLRENIFFKISSALFVLVECVCWYLMLFESDVNNELVKFLSIVLAVVFSLLYFKPNGVSSIFLSLAFALTALADYFLAYSTPIKKVPGVFVFCFVQIFYFLYLFSSCKSKKISTVHLITRCVVVAIAITALFAVVGKRVDFLSFISLFYIANLVVNAIFAYVQKGELLFAIGLTLFICCDIIVGLNAAINEYIFLSRESIWYKLAFSDFDLAWFFYLPSQVIIALSIALKNITKKPNG